MQLKAYSKGNIFLRISSWQMYFCVTCIFAILVFLRLRVSHKVFQFLLQFFFFLLVASPGKLEKVAFKFFSGCYVLHM